ARVSAHITVPVPAFAFSPDRICTRSYLNPQPLRPALEVAGHRVHPEAVQLGHVEPRPHRGDDRLGAVRARLEDEVRGRHAGRVAHAARRVPRGPEPEATRRVRIEEVAHEHAALDDGATGLPDALAVEWARRRAGGPERIVDHGDGLRGDLLAQPVE